MLLINSIERLINVYIGRRPDVKDWQANADLLKDVELEQMNQAVEYFEEMEEKYGEISAVTGNSLGGALANRVAVDQQKSCEFCKQSSYFTPVYPLSLQDKPLIY